MIDSKGDSRSQPVVQTDSAPARGTGIKRQFLWSMAPLLVVTVVNVFSVPLFYRSLGAEMYALWFYVITFSGIFGFADLGLGVAVGRYIGVALGKGDQESVRGYWATGNLVGIPCLLLMALAFAGIGVVLGPKWFNVSPGKEGLLRACFVAGGFSLFFGYYAQFWNILSQAYLDFKFIGLLRIVASLLQVIPALGLAMLGMDPLVLISWSAFIGVLQLAAFMWHARRHYHLGLNLREASFAYVREMAAYTGKNFAGLIFGSLFASIDRVILGRLASPAGFSYYTICGNLGARVQALSTSVMGPVFFNTSRAVGGARSASPAAIYNETFDFMFDWYLLAAVWTLVWCPVLLHVWLGQELALKVAPLLPPLFIASCLTAIANVSGAQLGPLNRIGTLVVFVVVAGLLAVAGVYIGWHFAGAIGVAYGFLCSRIAFIAQDLFVIRLVKAGGWLSVRTWKCVAAQGLVGGGFALSYLVFPSHSLWLTAPAVLHGGMVAAWLLRRPLRKWIAERAAVRNMRTTLATPRSPEP
jgi:O-antigen/teichoic acid export membrane protein